MSEAKPNNILVEIGQAITDARRELYLTQQQLADLTSISDRTLREIENGTGRTSFATVIKVVDALGLTIKVAQ